MSIWVYLIYRTKGLYTMNANRYIQKHIWFWCETFHLFTHAHTNAYTYCDMSMCWTLFRFFIYYVGIPSSNEARRRLSQNISWVVVCVLRFCATSWLDLCVFVDCSHSLLSHASIRPTRSIHTIQNNKLCVEKHMRWINFLVLSFWCHLKLIDVQCIIMWTLPYWCVNVFQLQIAWIEFI